MQIDFSTYAGITWTEEGTVYAISGGSPFRVATDPPLARRNTCHFRISVLRIVEPILLISAAIHSPARTLVTETRIVSITSTGRRQMTGRRIPAVFQGWLAFAALHKSHPQQECGHIGESSNGGVQGDDSTSGPLVFEDFDASHQVAGGDDATAPNRGDDADGNPVRLSANNPVVPHAGRWL